MIKRYIIGKDGVVRPKFFLSKKDFRAAPKYYGPRIPRFYEKAETFHKKYELAYRTRKLIKGKRFRVYKKKEIENFEFTFVLAFATREGHTRLHHWADSSFEIWVEDLVLDYEPSKKWLEDFVRGKLEPTLAGSEEMGWVFALGKVPSDKNKKIGEYWGIEIEGTGRPVHTTQLAKLFRTTDGDYEELRNCRKLLNLI